MLKKIKALLLFKFNRLIVYLSFIMNDASRYANSSQHSTINRHEDRKVPSPSPIPEPPIMNIYRCQVCNKQQQQQQGNMPICLQCRNNEENSRFIPNNIILVSQ